MTLADSRVQRKCNICDSFGRECVTKVTDSLETENVAKATLADSRVQRKRNIVTHLKESVYPKRLSLTVEYREKATYVTHLEESV